MLDVARRSDTNGIVGLNTIFYDRERSKTILETGFRLEETGCQPLPEVQHRNLASSKTGLHVICSVARRGDRTVLNSIGEKFGAFDKLRAGSNRGGIKDLVLKGSATCRDRVVADRERIIRRSHQPITANCITILLRQYLGIMQHLLIGPASLWQRQTGCLEKIGIVPDAIGIH